MKTFKHSGAMGDIIYSLPTVRALGGGIFYIGDSKLILQNADTLESLLRMQPYIYDVRFGNTEVDYDLDQFRNHIKPRITVPDMHFDCFGLDRSLKDYPWLTIAMEVTSKPVVVNRTARYLNDAFPWSKVRDKYENQACFVGLDEEHADFSKRFAWDIPHHKTETLLDAARVIAGSKLFVGNQSSCYAVAEGLKKPAVLEVWPFDPNCCFQRPGVTHGWDRSVHLPDI